MSGDSFLSRWSRLKRREEAPGISPEMEPEPAPPPTETPPTEILAETLDVLKDLPSLESLTAESDFTPFLRNGVPETLHRQALRKLWLSDPVYANDDGLKDYAGDYTSLFSGAVVKTLYRVGKGFLDTVEESLEKGQEAAGEAEVARAPDDDEKIANKAETAVDLNQDSAMPEKA